MSVETRDGSERSGELRELVRVFGKLGFIAFGGPAAHVAMMRQEVVERRRWMSDQEFLDLDGATNLIPGPNSTELAIHIGRERAGWRGLLVAGACFIVPATLIVLALAVVYERYGSTPPGQGLLYGITPVVIAVVAQALWGLLKAAIKGPLTAVVGAGALVLYLFLNVPEIPLLFGAALLVFAIENARRRWGAATLVGPLGIFLPAFVFVAITGPFIPRLRRSPILSSLLDGVNVASLALMAGVTWQLGRATVVDPLGAAIAVVALVLLLRLKVNSVWLVVGGGAVGFAYHEPFSAGDLEVRTRAGI